MAEKGDKEKGVGGRRKEREYRINSRRVVGKVRCSPLLIYGQE